MLRADVLYGLVVELAGSPSYSNIPAILFATLPDTCVGKLVTA